ncbi:MAG: hypothetical protein DDT29_00321 [Dehalococcoidia bacterium]|nr:hypothetical protein [Bacillota bacterium]
MPNEYRDNKQTIKADLSLFIAAIIWGAGFVITKNALDTFPPFYLLSYRFTIAVLVISAICYRKLKLINKKDIEAGLVMGFFLFTAFAAQVVGIQFITVGTSAFLTATYVVMVPFVYWFTTKKRPDFLVFSAVFLTLTGIAFITVNQGFRLEPGVSLTLLCAFLFACHIVSVGQYSKKHSTTILVIIQLGVAAIASIFCAIIFETHPADITLIGFSKIMYLAICSTLVCFFIQTVAQRFTTAAHTAIILSLEAVFGAIFGIILLGEILTSRMIVGFTIIFIAIITVETKWEFLKKIKSM